MSHHYSGPDFAFPNGDARLDFCDLFVFPKPGDESASILIMDAHPSVGVNPEGPTPREPFSPDAIYELRIDTDGDALANIGYRVRFSPSGGEGQTATVRRVEGADAAGTGDVGEIIIEGAPVSMGSEALVTQAGDYRFFAGWRSDPFFFDVGGALNNFQFTGSDFFADKDVCSIVLQVPNRDLATDRVHLWHRTLVRASGTEWEPVERGARTQQVVFLVPKDQKAAYVSGEPADDERFVEGFSHGLQQTGGYTPEEANRLARTMLPDVLPYDHTRPVAYPENGRLLTDDVADPFIAILTNGKVTEDKVGPHKDLLSEFPYLGPPHEA